jgi:SAM-dependent methyltransferase
MSDIARAIAELQSKKIIHVVKYRKSERTGLDIPVYSLSTMRRHRLDIHRLLAGVTSERLVEYDFVARNLAYHQKNANILDIGAAGSELAETIGEFRSTWHVFGIDLVQDCDAVMDARSAGFHDGAFDQVICISTIEHIGFANNIRDENGDSKAMQEVYRVLKKGGSAIVTVPYGRKSAEADYRVYDRKGLARLVGCLSVAKKEFYCYNQGKWIRCSQTVADIADSQVPIYFHSNACACLLLKKK